MTSRLGKEQWMKLYRYLDEHPGVYAGQEADCRRFIEGVGWVMYTGAQWRELPDAYGKWNSVYQRFSLRETGQMLSWLPVFRRHSHLATLKC